MTIFCFKIDFGQGTLCILIEGWYNLYYYLKGSTTVEDVLWIGTKQGNSGHRYKQQDIREEVLQCM